MQLPRVSSSRGGVMVRVLVFLLIFGGVITAAWIFFMPMILTSTLTKRTGYEVKVQRLAFNPFVARVDVQGLSIENPSSFPRSSYLQVRSFQAQAPIKTLFSDRPEFDWVRIDVSDIVFVRAADGTVNATLFYERLFPLERPVEPPEAKDKKAEEGGSGGSITTASGVKTTTKPTPKPGTKAAQPPPEPVRPAPKKMAFLIRRLELKVDKVTLDDHAAQPASYREFPIALEQTFENVTDPKQLMTVPVLRAIAPVGTAIGALIPGDLGRVLEAAAPATVPGGPASGKAADEIKSMADTLEETRKP